MRSISREDLANLPIRRYDGAVSLVATLKDLEQARAVYLFQLSRLDVFPALVELLAKPEIVKAGVGLAYDLRQLKLVFPFTVENAIDLGVVARRRGLGQTGVRNLAGMFLGFRIPKGNRTSNWAAPHLSSAQINYAATDAWACRELYLRFESEGLLTAAPRASA